MENKRNRVLLCLGSNWDKEKNMERAAEMLRAHFVFIQFSQPVYTEPIEYVLDGICSLLAAGENDEWCQ